jgi:3-phenylpropionate/cinnamic acid dioxygenase small subunit
MITGVEQLLFREAQLLDSARFDDWLDLLALDLRYWAPVRAEVGGEQEAESEASRLPLFDETKASLRLRVSRLQTGVAWVETPPTRTRRFISNITAEKDTNGLVRVRSNFMVFRSRSFTEEWFVVGCRDDRWANADKWLLKERKIMLDHCTIENMSLFL